MMEESNIINLALSGQLVSLGNGATSNPQDWPLLLVSWAASRGNSHISLDEREAVLLNPCKVSILAPQSLYTKLQDAWGKRLANIHKMSQLVQMTFESLLCSGYIFTGNHMRHNIIPPCTHYNRNIHKHLLQSPLPSIIQSCFSKFITKSSHQLPPMSKILRPRLLPGKVEKFIYCLMFSIHQTASSECSSKTAIDHFQLVPAYPVELSINKT